MVSNVLIKFIYTPFLLRELGQSEYGLFSLVMSIVGYMAVLDFGFGSTVTRYTVKYRNIGDRHSLYKLYGTLSVIYVIIGVAALVICCILSYCSPQLFSATMTGEEISKLKLMIILCGINLLFTFPLQISASILVAYECFIFKTGINLIKTYLQPTVMILLLYLVHVKSVGAIVVVTLFNLFTYLIYYIYSVRKLNFVFAIKYFEPNMIKELLAFSLSMFFLMVFEQLQYNSGQFILGLFQGTDVIAVWGIAMIFILNYRSLSTAITNVFLPSYISDAFNKDADAMANTTYKMTRIQGFVLFAILANFFLFGQFFIDLWAGENYHDAYRAALIIMVPMTFALLLDFSYLIQIAKNKLTYRIVTVFSGYAFSFVVFCLTMRISLITYACVVASSMLIGQIICVYFYIVKNIKVDVCRLIKDLSKILAPTLCLTLFSYAFLRNVNLPLLGIILSVLLFNVLLLGCYWLIAHSGGGGEKKKVVIVNIKK